MISAEQLLRGRRKIFLDANIGDLHVKAAFGREETRQEPNLNAAA
jgi:hypothetical protein